MLLPPPLETVGDLCAFLQHAYLVGSSSSVGGRNKKRALVDTEAAGAGAGAGAGAASASPPQELQLTIGGFLLPPEAPIAILRDNDVVRVQEPGQQADAVEPPAPAPKRRKGCEQAETEAKADSGGATTPAPALAPTAKEEGVPVGAAAGEGTKRRRKKKKRSKGTSGAQEQTQMPSQPPALQQQPPQQPAAIPPAGAGSAPGKHVRFGEEAQAQQEPAIPSPEQAPSETPAGVAASPEQQHEEREGARVDTLAHVHPSRRSAFVQRQDGSWTSQGRPPKPPSIFLPRCLRVTPKMAAVAASASSSQAEEDKDKDNTAAASSSSSSDSDSSDSDSSESEADEEEEASVSGASSVGKRDASYAGEYKRPYALVAVAGEQDAAAAAAQQQQEEQELAQYPPFPTGRRPWPAVGDVLCFRVLEFSEATMTPELTGYKTGRVVEVRPRDGELDVALVDDDGGQETLELAALQEVRVKEGPTREFLERPPSPPSPPSASPPVSAEEEGDVLLEGAPEGGIEDLGALIRQKRLSLLSASSTPGKADGDSGGQTGRRAAPAQGPAAE